MLRDLGAHTKSLVIIGIIPTPSRNCSYGKPEIELTSRIRPVEGGDAEDVDDLDDAEDSDEPFVFSVALDVDEMGDVDGDAECLVWCPKERLPPLPAPTLSTLRLPGE